MYKITYLGCFAAKQFVQAPKIHLELSENRFKNFHLRLCENVANICYIFWFSQTLEVHAFFFIRIDIFQPSLKPILNFWSFQPQNILKLFLKF